MCVCVCVRLCTYLQYVCVCVCTLVFVFACFALDRNQDNTVSARTELESGISNSARAFMLGGTGKGKIQDIHTSTGKQARQNHEEVARSSRSIARSHAFASRCVNRCAWSACPWRRDSQIREW